MGQLLADPMCREQNHIHFVDEIQPSYEYLVRTSKSLYMGT